MKCRAIHFCIALRFAPVAPPVWPTGRAGQLDREKDHMNYFYILKSEKDEMFYYGSTNDLKRRFGQHVDGKVRATSYRLPVNLVYYEAYASLGQARNREKQVKNSGSVRQSIHMRI